MNTMTDAEWGTGAEDPAWFDPDDLDADAWIDALADAELTGVILTAKHHDGFCLWPTRTTSHSVAASPWRGGRGDLVREVADAARRRGLAFGVYLSPWDLNHPTYGQGAAYDDVYLAQLTELLTGYGPIFAVWLDGANGGTPQTYDWDRYYARVRELQPDAVISVCGPDVRWCGNEAGHTRPQEWSVVPATLRDAERTASRSQTADDGTFARLVRSDEEDLGSRAALEGVTDLVWYPAEVNTSIRPGWFHHPAEDALVRSGAELFELYLAAVGGNATLLLNVPPDRHGRLAAPDVEALADLGRRIRALRASVLTASVTASSSTLTLPDGVPAVASAPHHTRARWSPGVAGTEPWWAADPADPEPTLRLVLEAPARVHAFVLKEAIAHGQRVEDVVVLGRTAGEWRELARTTCVGYQRIVPVSGEVDAVEVRFTSNRAAPVLAGAAVLGTLTR
ncbi:MAG TPA: alpha-L-fucosidase [Micrococcales bacterium]|nr:alpha-L-fucosidase [Micrococcales bacterium]